MLIQKIKDPASLSFGNWMAVVGLAILVPTVGYWLPVLFTGLTKLAKFSTYITASFALAASIWAAIQSYKLKLFEIQRGYKSAYNLVSADAQGALEHAREITLLLNCIDYQDISKGLDEWNELVDKVGRHVMRYNKKQEQLPLLSTYFPAQELLTIRNLYLAIEDIWIDSEMYAVGFNDGLKSDEKANLFQNRVNKLRDTLRESSKSVIRYYQELPLINLPSDLFNFFCRSDATQQSTQADADNCAA